MTKHTLTARIALFLTLAALAPLAAQSGEGTASFSTGYVLNKFPETSVEDGWLRCARGIVQEAKLSNDDRKMWGGLVPSKH